MKKLLLAAMGLTGLLASCGGTVVVTPGVTPVRVTQVTDYDTQYTAQADYYNTSGTKVISAGESMICDNLTTQVFVKFNWTGDLGSATLRLRGVTQDTVTNTVTVAYPSGFTADGGVQVALAAGVAPRSVGGGLSTQAIVVTPRNIANVLGYSFLEMQVRDAAGNLGTINGAADDVTFQSVKAIPIVTCQ
ncbi:hypothetical protein [Deinococcus yunweiensis]|uniref:hypothetical protein n=1 Tax=Deinococcus yunweiensis TaxID=367282 RepID=UPI00398E6F67